LLIAEYTRVNISLLDAVEQTANLRAGGTSDPSAAQTAHVPSEEEIARKNEVALRELSSMMGGLGT